MISSIIEIVSPNVLLCVMPLCGGLIFSNIFVIIIPLSIDMVAIVIGMVIAYISLIIRRYILVIVFWYGCSSMDVMIMVKQSSVYLNILYVFEDGWSISGIMLPSSVIGIDIPINAIISSNDIWKYIGVSIMVVSVCVFHPYFICVLNPPMCCIYLYAYL